MFLRSQCNAQMLLVRTRCVYTAPLPDPNGAGLCLQVHSAHSIALLQNHIFCRANPLSQTSTHHQRTALATLAFRKRRARSGGRRSVSPRSVSACRVTTPRRLLLRAFSLLRPPLLLLPCVSSSSCLRRCVKGLSLSHACEMSTRSCCTRCLQILRSCVPVRCPSRIVICGARVLPQSRIASCYSCRLCPAWTPQCAFCAQSIEEDLIRKKRSRDERVWREQPLCSYRHLCVRARPRLRPRERVAELAHRQHTRL